MRLNAYDKVPPMICSSSNARHSSSRSPRHSSKPSFRHQRLPASLDIIRLNKRFQPRPQPSDDQEQSDQSSKKQKRSYTQDISLLEFTPEKPSDLDGQELEDDNDGSEGGVKVSFFNEEQECSVNGVPILSRVRASITHPLTPPQPTSIRKKKGLSSGMLETYEDSVVDRDMGATDKLIFFTLHDDDVTSEHMVTATKLYDNPGSLSSTSAPALAGKTLVNHK